MRQCVVIIGSEAQGDLDVPEIRQGEEGAAMQTKWCACLDQESPENLYDDTRSTLMRLLKWPVLTYRCYLFVSNVKTWSNKRPFVFVRGGGPAARLAARAASWAAGDVVQTEDDPAGRLPQTRYLLRKDGSLKLLG